MAISVYFCAPVAEKADASRRASRSILVDRSLPSHPVVAERQLTSTFDEDSQSTFCLR